MKKSIFFLSILSAMCFNLAAQKIGGKVKVFSKSNGQWKNATILSIKNGQYFVHFDNYSEVYDRLVKDSDIIFIDGDDRKPVIVKDTVYITKTRVDTLFKVKDNNVVVRNNITDTVYQTTRDTVFILKKIKDTVSVFKRDTIFISKTAHDTIFKIKRDTVVINRTIKDTVINTKTEVINSTPVKTPGFKLGDLVLAYQDAEWKPAVIIEIKGGDLYKVKYDGLSDYYNNVVGVGSLKPRNSSKTETNTTSVAFKLGDLVQVYQGTEWKPAVIIEIKGGDLYKVKYDGLSDYYNNVVGVGSIKPR